jgi:hypothetical protein
MRPAQDPRVSLLSARGANQVRRFARETPFGRADMRQEGGKCKNFFVAKKSDSESARIESGPRRSVAITARSSCAIAQRIEKTTVAQPFPA